MPNENVAQGGVQGVPASSGTLGSVFMWAFIGFIGGVLVSLASAFIFVQSGAMQAVINGQLSSRYAAQAQQSSQQIAAIVPGLNSVPPANVGASAGTSTVLVPKDKASKNSFVDLNALVTTMNAISTDDKLLTQALAGIQSISVSGKLAGLFDLVYQAKDLTQKEKNLNLQMAAELERLDSDASGEVDVQTRNLMGGVVLNGRDFKVALDSYLSGVDGLLTGEPPSAKQVQDFQGVVATVVAKSKTLVASIGSLLDYFGVQKVLN